MATTDAPPDPHKTTYRAGPNMPKDPAPNTHDKVADDEIKTNLDADRLLEWLRYRSAHGRHMAAISLGAIVLILTLGTFAWSGWLVVAAVGFTSAFFVSYVEDLACHARYAGALGLFGYSLPNTPAGLRKHFLRSHVGLTLSFMVAWVGLFGHAFVVIDRSTLERVQDATDLQQEGKIGNETR